MERTALRRSASVFFGIAILVVLFSAYVALVYHGDIDEGASWVVDLDFDVWISIFAVTLAVIFAVLLIMFLVPASTGGGPAPAPPTGTSVVRIDCTNCHQLYEIDDTGERPLFHTCPHCGFVAEMGGEPTAASAPAPSAPVPSATATTDEKGPMVIRCGNCQTNFEVPFTTERPLVTVCTNCGRRGILNAPAAEASA
ncbi:MAG: hypothetical protein HYT80_04350 [Euryarchaeota archaeon]|nr:hypothetical protein [Euryarchaeota archaeon]